MQSASFLVGLCILISTGIAAPSNYPDVGNPVPTPLNLEFVGKYGNKTYFTDYSVVMSQNKAKLYCSNLDLQLVSIASDEEKNFLASNLKTNIFYWTSGRDRGNADQMFWETSGLDIKVGLETGPTPTYGVQLYVDLNRVGTLRTYSILNESNNRFPLCQQL